MNKKQKGGYKREGKILKPLQKPAVPVESTSKKEKGTAEKPVVTKFGRKSYKKDKKEGIYKTVGFIEPPIEQI